MAGASSWGKAYFSSFSIYTERGPKQIDPDLIVFRMPIASSVHRGGQAIRAMAEEGSTPPMDKDAAEKDDDAEGAVWEDITEVREDVSEKACPSAAGLLRLIRHGFCNATCQTSVLAAKAMGVGEMLCGSDFSLGEAMSVLQLMDPKMDDGMAEVGGGGGGGSTPSIAQPGPSTP